MSTTHSHTNSYTATAISVLGTCQLYNHASKK